jgi:hypothetical protein
MRPTRAPLPIRFAVLGACLVSALVLNDCDDEMLGSGPPGGAAGQIGGGQGGASAVVTDAASDGRVIEPDGGPGNQGVGGTKGLGGFGGTFCATPCGDAQGGFGGTKGRAGSEGTAGTNGAAYIDGSVD